MGRLIYAMNVSLDGFIETPDHSLDWTSVDDELHGWFNDRFREIGASFYGRRLYEVMAAHWPTAQEDPTAGPVELEFARIWNATPRIVFSSTLERVDWNSRLVRGDPIGELARVRSEVQGDIEVAGPTLAANFVQAGLVDVYQLIVHPVILGAGKPFFPPLATPIKLRLIETQTFASGVTYLGYEPA